MESTPDVKELRFRCVELAVTAGALHDDVVNLATQIEEYVQRQHHSLPDSTGCKV